MSAVVHLGLHKTARARLKQQADWLETEHPSAARSHQPGVSTTTGTLSLETDGALGRSV